MTIKKTAATTAKKSPVKKTSAPAKSTVKAAPKPAAKKTKKVQKVKVVRDSFTMPQNEYQKIAEIKATCLKSKMHVKKSEVLRAGLKVLAKLNSARLKLVLNGLEKIKTGRPKKH
ncbi:MAG: hypothetical protein WCA63_12960 [Gallionella sp.]